MKITKKQQKLIDEIFNRVKEKFPEIIFKDLQRGAEDPRDIWINVIADMDEDRKIEFRHYSSSIGNELFFRYGIDISLFAEKPNNVFA